MPQQNNKTITLNNGVEMPLLGLGVFQTKDGREVENAVRWALAAGYRSVDTAAMYRNETGVGNAVRSSSLPREEIFVTTKVWNSDQGYDSTLRAFDLSLNKLGLDYIDLYLVHWPVQSKFNETWRALEMLYESNRVKAIGVSNFLRHHLDDLLQGANVVPAVNQIEHHPYLQQADLIAYCRKLGIVPEAWSPIMKGRVTEVPELIQIGEKYGKTAVQVTLRWMVQRNIVTIPKSANRERIQANSDIFDFTLTGSDIAVIDSLDKGERIGPDPNNFTS